MKSYENEIYDGVAKLLRNSYDGISVNGTTILSPASFPCASIEEIDNTSFTADSSGEIESYSTFEINVFSNSLDGKKAEAQRIFNTIDGYFTNLHYSRTSKRPVVINDGTVYRIVARYSAVYDVDGKIFRRR